MFRCLSVVTPEISKAVSIKKRNLMMVICIWVYAIILVLPTSLQWYGRFGYDSYLGKCDFLETEGTVIHPRKLFLGAGFIVPFFLIVFSYFTIWRTSIRSSSFLKHNS